ncbi:MAG TPA: hypothetical protein VLH40_09505 [Atribacteraceae bacterium]|nr:hypothetical protein [Atribacteraceae bacterium]
MKRLFTVLLSIVIIGIIHSAFFFRSRHPGKQAFLDFNTWTDTELSYRCRSFFPERETLTTDLNRRWDSYSPVSLVSLLSWTNEPVVLDRETFELFTRLVRYHQKKAAGCFSIKVGSLVIRYSRCSSARRN